MKKKPLLLPVLGLVFLLTNCVKHEFDSALQQGAKKLGARQITALVDGSSLQLKGYGQTATVEFRQDGTLVGTNTIGEKDKGEWKVKGDDLCIAFKKWGQGDALCYQVVQSANDYQLYTRKGMMIYDVSVLTAGEKILPQEVTPTVVNGSAVAPSSPSATKATPVYSEPALTPSPQAAADVDFIIRQSAQNCPGCNLAHAQLAGQTLIGANLQGANLTEANLSHANLRRANLRGANLYRADLRQADLAGADLTGANLSEALRE